MGSNGGYQYKYMKNNKSANDWLAELMQSSGPSGLVDEVPEGWITLVDMAQQTCLSLTTMNSRVQKLLLQNKLQRKKFRIKTGRAISDVWHYNKV